MLHGIEYPFSHLGSVVSAVSFPKSFLITSLLTMEAVEKTESLGITQDLFRNSQNTGLLSTLHCRVFYQGHELHLDHSQYSIVKRKLTQREKHIGIMTCISAVLTYTQKNTDLYMTTVKSPWDKNIKYRER